MPMKNPPHPGRSVRDSCLGAVNLTVTDGAKFLGVARHTLSRMLNGQAGISPAMAIRLEKAGRSNAGHCVPGSTKTRSTSSATNHI